MTAGRGVAYGGYLRLLLTIVATVAAFAFVQSAAAAPLPTRWCGAEAAADQPDTADNVFQVHVVYAYAADAPDQFGTRILPLIQDIAAIDGWWRSQDATRAPRFDLASLPGCDTDFGQLDVSSVKLPQPAASYADPDKIVQRISQDLTAAGFGDPDKKYLVYYDGTITQAGTDLYVCGESPTSEHGGGPFAYSVAFLVHPCGDGLGSATFAAATAAHELIHGLGALPPGAPHPCPGDSGHPCDVTNDIMRPTGSGEDQLSGLVLDGGRDDYYGHGGSWWDVRQSTFLLHLDQPLVPPSAPASPTATGAGAGVTLSWTASTSPNGTVAYRVFKDGKQVQRSGATTFSESIPPGTTTVYAIQAIDSAGELSPIATVHFTMGLGVVDAGGALLQDTIPATGVARLRVTKTKTGIVLTWTEASDGGGLAGYRVTHNGKPLAKLAPQPALTVGKASAKGTWQVRAIDKAGNAGPPSPAVTVR